MSQKTVSGRPTSKHRVARPPFGAPQVFVLAVIDGDDPHVVHRIQCSETVIGRDASADLVVVDSEVSKRHCLIRADGTVCTVTDLGSLNGTRLNGRPLRQGIAQRMRHLDQLQLGTTSLLLLSGKFRSIPTSPD